MHTLFIIPARGGSKGIPGKNVRLFAGKPLLSYSIDLARQFAADADICLSTDDDAIAGVAEGMGLHLPFRRPPELSTDTASSEEVIRHALDFYTSRGNSYDNIVLLQPTSPLRQAFHVKEALALYSPDIDLVLSVKLAEANPYFDYLRKPKMVFWKNQKQAHSHDGRIVRLSGRRMEPFMSLTCKTSGKPLNRQTGAS